MTAPTADRPGGPPADRRAGSALAVPAFRRLWSAGVVSDGGDWLLFIALPLVVLRLSGSALTTSVAFLLELLPPILLAPLVTRIVARTDPRRLMVVVNVVQACGLVPLLLVGGRGLPAGTALTVVCAVIVLQAACSAVFEPAKNTLLPTLVGADRVVSANALVGLNQDVGRLVGGPLGGVLLVVGGLPLVAGVDLATYVVSALVLAGLPRAEPAAGGSASGRRRAADATASRASEVIRAFRATATRGPLVVVTVASVAQGMFVVLFVFFVRDRLGGSDGDVGLLRGVQAVGAIGAGLVLTVLASRVRVRRVALTGLVAFAVLTVVVWNLSYATHTLWPYVVLFALVGAPGVLMGSGLTSLLQLGAAEHARPAVFAALGLGVAVGQAVGMLGAGALQGVVGTMPLLEVQAAAYVLAMALGLVALPRGVAERPLHGAR